MSRQATATRPGLLRSRFALVAGAGAIAVIALIPRATGLDVGFMIDESLWLDRSVTFVDAVADGRLGDAYTTGHPGVTTSWIGGLAQRTLPDDAPLRDRYARARLAMGIVSVLLLLAIWMLSRPFLGEVAAGLGAVLLAFDPFVLAHTRVLHLDGLQTLAMIASFIALLRASRDDDRRMLVLSGAFGGFALATRTFGGFALIVAVVVLARDGKGLRRIVPWLGAAGVVFVALWPVMWVRPWKAVSLLIGGAASGALEDSDAGRFFLGFTIPPPGPLYYPVAVALRTSIVGLLGGVATGVWAFRRRRVEPEARTALAFLLYGLGFVAAVGLSFKTADRYALPAIAALDFALAIGIVHALRRFAPSRRAVAVAALLALHAGPALALHPYELAHFNWAVGGPVAAQHAMPIGRAEGLDEAARDLAVRLADATSVTIASTRLQGFEEFFPGRTIRIEDSSLDHPGGEPAHLALFYISSIQTSRVPEIWERFRERAPLYTLSINGIPYVRVYRIAT